MNDITFTSRINFVNTKTFNESLSLKSKYFRCWPLGECFVKAEEFNTDGIRTCTAGGLINTKTKEAVGFHFYDGHGNQNKVSEFINSLFQMIKNPDRCLLIGGKNTCGEFSVENFEKFKTILTERVKNISVFGEQLTRSSTSDISYSAKNDEWNICSLYNPIENRHDARNSISSIDELKKCFRTVNIAEGDALYIDGELVKIII